MTDATFTLHQDNFGRLIFTSAQGVVHENVTPVRAFPISAPEEGFSLVSLDGTELAWIERLTDLPQSTRQSLESKLANHEFVPEIKRLLRASTFMTPSLWTVDTDRGQTTFTLRGEEDIRRLASGHLLISDSHGIHYLIRDINALDKPSRKILDRFL